MACPSARANPVLHIYILRITHNATEQPSVGVSRQEERGGDHHRLYGSTKSCQCCDSSVNAACHLPSAHKSTAAIHASYIGARCQVSRSYIHVNVVVCRLRAPDIAPLLELAWILSVGQRVQYQDDQTLPEAERKFLFEPVLTADDYCIGLIDVAQCRRFFDAAHGSVLIADAKMGTCRYGGGVLGIHGVDKDSWRGVPGAYLVSLHQTTEVVTKFFEALRLRLEAVVGEAFVPVIAMTDYCPPVQEAAKYVALPAYFPQQPSVCTFVRASSWH